MSAAFRWSAAGQPVRQGCAGFKQRFMEADNTEVSQ